MNVLKKVVEKKICIGCGMCVAVCPKNRLEMKWNKRGEYNPVEIEGSNECGENCSLCYKVCPAHGNTKNETHIGKQWFGGIKGIHYKEEIGYYLSSYVGYSVRHRMAGASGGMATWILERLLQSGEVDAVGAVGRTSDPDKLFEFRICSTVKELRSCSRSAYYPVEVSGVVSHILKNKGQYAIIGLPCVCKAIRLAQDKLTILKRRIKYVIGLTCGHQCSKFFAEYICALGGGNPHELKEFIFRKKDLTQPASNLAMLFRAGEGDKEVVKKVLWRDGIDIAYSNGYFQIPGCFYCDDVFAECADVTCMDAWLPEYVKDSKGTSLLIIRRPELDNLVSENSNINEIDLNSLIYSQRAALRRKRSPQFSKDSPKLRSFQKKPFFIDRLIEAQRMKISIESGRLWNGDIANLEMALDIFQRKIGLLQLCRRVVTAPFKVPSRLLSKIKENQREAIL